MNLVLNNPIDYLLIIGTFILFLFNIKINQFVVKQETISALIPFENL
jgi:hypothetical protein